MQPDPTAPPRPSQSRNIFIGCLVALAVFVGLAGIGGYMLYRMVINGFISAVETQIAPQIKSDIDASPLPAAQKTAAKAAVDRVVLDLKEGRISPWNQKSWVDPTRRAVKDFIAALDLPAAQKAGINAQVDRLADGLLDDTLTPQQIGKVTENLTSGPFGAAVAVWAMQVQYVYGSTLDEAGKRDAERQLDRVARGVTQKTITMAELDEAAKPYMAPAPATPDTGDQKLKPTLTLDELNGLIGAMRKLADEKGMPDEAFEVDYAAELKKAIDAAVGP